MAAYLIRQENYGAFGEWKLALADREAAARIEPRGGYEGYRLRAIAYLQRGDYDSAVADIDRWIAVNPDSALAYELRADAYLNKRDAAQAIADASNAIRLSPKHA